MSELRVNEDLIERCYAVMKKAGQCVHDVEPDALEALVRFVARECAKIADDACDTDKHGLSPITSPGDAIRSMFGV